MASSGHSVFEDRRSLMGSLALWPLPNPVYSPYWFLATVPKKLWDQERHDQYFELDWPSMLGGESRVQFIPITKAGGFLCLGISALAISVQNPPVRPAVDSSTVNFLIQITSANEGPFFSDPLPLENVATGINGGGQPGCPFWPTFFEVGDMLTIQITSLWLVGEVTPQTLNLTLTGTTYE